MLGQRFFAAAMDVAHRGPHLGVGVAVDVFLQKIEESTFALEERQELHRAGNAVVFGDHRRNSDGRRQWRGQGQRLGRRQEDDRLLGKTTGKQHQKEAAEREKEAHRVWRSLPEAHCQHHR